MGMLQAGTNPEVIPYRDEHLAMDFNQQAVVLDSERMTVYGKQGLRELAEQNLAKSHYLARKTKPRFTGKFFNEFVVRTEGKSPEVMNKALLKKKIIGGLPLGRFYPELADSMLLCATEMTRRADMDSLAEVLA